MRFPRSSGIVCHVSSLPGRYGIGDLGPAALDYVAFLARTRQSIWQVLPIGPTGYGNSPYQSFSAFAGNPLFVSPERLIDDGWLEPHELSGGPDFDPRSVDFEAVIPWRRRLLETAWQRFERDHTPALRQEFAEFLSNNDWWLDDYALFAALKEHAQQRAWTSWQVELVHRDPAALRAARQRLAEPIAFETFVQFAFARQWFALKREANRRGIRLLGDLPIFVAHDSADVWTAQDMFWLEPDGRPSVVAGVPPDYFSVTGQLWGNPLYRWERHAQRGFDWWIRRLAYALQLFDVVRVDHFRGFEAYWEIPAGAQTAASGRWVPGPGLALFRAIESQLGPVPLIAEDLGVITPLVEALRDAIGAPGMRVLQFAFGNDAKASDYKPHNYPRHCVVYTGTHDNDTTVGWFHSRAGVGTTRSQAEIDREREMVLRYTGTDGRQIAWDMIRLAWGSVADTAIAPMQDLMELGSEARMNLPGTTGNNWRWRYLPEQLTAGIEARLTLLTETFERDPRARETVAAR